MGSGSVTGVIEQKFKASAKKLLKDEPVQIWNKRDNEPSYALLRNNIAEGEKASPNQQAKALNVYDQPIDLIELVNQSVPRGQSLYINGNPAVGDNPNRNKQHGFYFTADNCIGCHACESACAEKNETPAHLAFRSVGYVEGGSYPDFQRLNISMACNHCDDPVCLKGCPTLAYTKHTEYGAVLQDPDTCFGCGYCTWVCPYNAPQLDPVKGQVSKCNMCVDRLEVGLKPACVSACVGNALDFGVVEDIPENRDQAKTSIPGFPTPDISHPNIRFQQKKGLPEEMTRTDSAPIKYHLDAESGNYQPEVDPKHGHEKHWNIAQLSSRENPLVLFTLSTQVGVGAFVIPFLGALFGVEAMQALYNSDWYIGVPALGFFFAALGLFLSTTHLGKPQRFYRGFNNLRYSPLSREALGVAVFMAFAGFHLLTVLPANGFLMGLLSAVAGSDLTVWQSPVRDTLATLTGSLAVLGALMGLFYMHKCYRIPARPFWNHWQTATSFVGNTLSLGGLVAMTVAVVAAQFPSEYSASLMQSLATFGWIVTLGLALELTGLYFQAKDNCGAKHEGAVSQYVQTTTYGKTYIARNVLLTLALMLSLFTTLAVTFDVMASPLLVVVLWIGVCFLATTTALVGRALFYVLVIPTTMPGAFFWRNKGFEEHAKQTGLADVVDLGVVSGRH